ncbi:MAG: transposase, partial [Halomonas sp.]
MATYRRAHIPGGTYFFTVVTYGRQPLLADHLNINALGRAFRRVKEERPFTMDAFVLMPDHLHCIWTLPEGDADYSSRWRDGRVDRTIARSGPPQIRACAIDALGSSTVRFTRRTLGARFSLAVTGVS